MIPLSKILSHGFVPNVLTPSDLKEEEGALIYIRETTPSMLTLMTSSIPLHPNVFKEGREQDVVDSLEGTDHIELEVFISEVDDSIKFTEEELEDFMRWITSIERRHLAGEIKSNHE